MVRLAETKLNEAHQMLKGGATYRSAARAIGCSAEGLRRRFPGFGQKPADLDEFEWLIRSGEWPPRAAARLGVSLNAIEQAARRQDRMNLAREVYVAAREDRRITRELQGAKR